LCFVAETKCTYSFSQVNETAQMPFTSLHYTMLLRQLTFSLVGNKLNKTFMLCTASAFATVILLYTSCIAKLIDVMSVSVANARVRVFF